MINALTETPFTTMDLDVLSCLCSGGKITQRKISEETGYSLGAVNKSLQNLTREGYLNIDGSPSEKAASLRSERTPKNAVILAAGAGLRMLPINNSIPKALLKVHGEVMIERLIRQLKEAGISDITVVVGFMKEAFEYLIDRFDVELIVNSRFMDTNNLYSLSLAKKKLSNTYIVPCDIYCEKNPFRKIEFYPWYMLSERSDLLADYRVSRKLEIVQVAHDMPGNREIGIAYLTEKLSVEVAARMEELTSDRKNQQFFWEEALVAKKKWILPARVVADRDYVEINTYEQLRALDCGSDNLKGDAIGTICELLHVEPGDIRNIEVVKKGMMNRSFLFTCKGRKYIMRVPEPETNKLVNRYAEAEIYAMLKGRDICDNCLYINPENGYKIAEFIPDARCMDPYSEEDIRKCMAVVKRLHEASLSCCYRIDFFRDIEHYESLWEGKPSIFEDYAKTRENVFRLKPFIEKYREPDILCHIDVNPDNFLIYTDSLGEEHVRLIDWEYAAMQDPDIDPADFIIYVMYDKEHTERFIDLYFEGKCEPLRRAKIYAYMASCGLAWSNWCECKRHQGVEFGEYALRQYRYAKDYYRKTVEALEALGMDINRI